MEKDKLRVIFGQLADSRHSARAERLLTEFIEAYSDILAVKIRYYLGEREELVEEALGDVFVTMWQERPNLAQVENPVAWLINICRNRAVSVHRQEDRHARGKAWLLDGFTPEEDGTAFVDRLEYAEQLALIERCVEALPPQQRKVYVMRKFDGLTTKSVANVLGIAEATVKRHQQLAYGRMRGLIAQIRKDSGK